MTLTVQDDVLLAPHTTLAVGGPARLWIEASTVSEVQAALAMAEQRSLPLLVLGGGSNVVVADRGIDAVVLRPRLEDLDCRRDDDRLRIHAGAGVAWDDLVELAVRNDGGGIECLAGIPGEVGAAPIQNIGAYGQEVADSIGRVLTLDRSSGQEVSLTRQQCAFGYRDSAFKTAAKDRYVIVGVEFELQRGAPPRIAYPELQRAVSRQGDTATLATVRNAVLALRRQKSMLLDQEDPNHRSAGSFFVNPTLTTPAFADLIARAAAVLGKDPGVPHHPVGHAQVKVPAAWLIEQAGFPKGSGGGRVGLSTRHSLAIVNRGGATAAEVVAFAVEVRGRVRDRFGVTLTPEPQLLGFEPAELVGLCD
jgi:UDP-N-acetylmuramate dehydrogenase